MRERVATGAWLRAVGFALAALVGFTGIAGAEPPPPREWDLGLGLYGWLTAMELAVEGQALGNDFSRDYHKDLGDAFSDWDGGGGGFASFRYQRFVGLVDGAWVQTDAGSGTWLTNKIIDAKVGYRVLDRNPHYGSTPSRGRHFFLDLLAGARYREADADIEDTFSGPSGVFSLDIDENQDWVDPVVGLRTGVELVHNLSFGTVADIGGFDIGNASHLTWSVNPRLNYRAWDHLDLFIGWRHLRDNRNDDLEIGLNGPQAGLGYSF